MTTPSLPAGLQPAAPSLERHEELVRCAQLRKARASQRLERAQAEDSDAATALERAIAARTDWIANCPDPQLIMI